MCVYMYICIYQRIAYQRYYSAMQIRRVCANFTTYNLVPGILI